MSHYHGEGCLPIYHVPRRSLYHDSRMYPIHVPMRSPYYAPKGYPIIFQRDHIPNIFQTLSWSKNASLSRSPLRGPIMSPYHGPRISPYHGPRRPPYCDSKGHPMMVQGGLSIMVQRETSFDHGRETLGNMIGSYLVPKGLPIVSNRVSLSMVKGCLLIMVQRCLSIVFQRVSLPWSKGFHYHITK